MWRMLPTKHHLHIKQPKCFVVFASFFLYRETRIQRGITKGKFNANGRCKSSLRDARGVSVCRAHHGWWCSPAKHPAEAHLQESHPSCSGPLQAVHLQQQSCPFWHGTCSPFPARGLLDQPTTTQCMVQLGRTLRNEETPPPGALGRPFFYSSLTLILFMMLLKPYCWESEKEKSKLSENLHLVSIKLSNSTFDNINLCEDI